MPNDLGHLSSFIIEDRDRIQSPYLSVIVSILAIIVNVFIMICVFRKKRMLQTDPSCFLLPLT
jgi:hypothetical protein